MPNMQLDEFDRRIVAALQADGRLSNVELAERIGLSPSPCLRRVKRLEREALRADPEAQENFAHAMRTQCILAEDRCFLRRA